MWLPGLFVGEATVRVHGTARSETPPSFLRSLEPADFAIEVPDLHIAAVDKLASGQQRLGVAFGFDRFVGRNAIVFIDQVGPIGRHGDLLIRREQRLAACRVGAGSHAGTDGTKIRRIGTLTETIDEQRHYRIWNIVRLVSDGSGNFETTGRTLPPSRQTGRPLHPKTTIGSRLRIRGAHRPT